MINQENLQKLSQCLKFMDQFTSARSNQDPVFVDNLVFRMLSLFLVCLLILFFQQKRGLHDIITGTMVVKK